MSSKINSHATSAPLHMCDGARDAASPRGLRPHERLMRREVHSALGSMDCARLDIRDADGTASFGRVTQCDDPVASITILDPSFYLACALKGLVGAAEGYMDGAWQADDLTAVVRAMARNADSVGRIDGGLGRFLAPVFAAFASLHRNTREGSRKNIAAHYDLGNDMFELFLDPTMTYSSGVFEHAASSLEDAQHAKYERLCGKLDLGPGDRVLEIGTGWGGFAIHAARTRGCHVTTTTISAEQHELARERVARAGVNDRVDALLRDYRDLGGRYDKIVSIEMIEAVGHQYMEEYFRVLSDRLAPDGLCALQAIVNRDQMFEQSKKSIDFIRRYIFPGGHLPSVWSMSDAVKNATDLRMVHLEDISAHYARTLAAWRVRFGENLVPIRALGYSERFIKMWEFYLSYCEGGFLERRIGAVQVVFEKPGARHEWVRSLPSPRVRAA